MVGNLTKRNKKCQMPGGQPGGGGGGMGTLGFDSYINSENLSQLFHVFYGLVYTSLYRRK